MATCRKCGEKVFALDLRNGLCHFCQKAQAEMSEEEKETQLREDEALSAELSKIMLTTETAPSLPIEARLGIVTSEYVVGMHLFRDIAGAFRDVFGGRSATMQRGLKEAREAALNELRKEAHQLGADAVVAIDLDYSEISGGGKSMLFLVASGTAVSLAKAG